ncbi:hypothetical protein J4Q44_G00223990 [Coregonus suidteri]|uniref:Uncharacterized protein n=1 Tax=Coregonus suidteri TaxID=861788 RepID=A0AAN8QPF7_9TELE
MSGSGGHTAARMQEQRNMLDLQAFLEDGLRSELLLQRQLQAIKEAHKQQLQETERRQRVGLEKRIQQNSMLSAGVDRRSSTDRQLDKLFSSRGPRRSSSMSDLTSGKRSTSRTSQQVYHILCSLGIHHNCYTDRITATSAPKTNRNRAAPTK